MLLKKWCWHIIAVAIILFDQVAKILVMNNISEMGSIHIIPKVIDFVYVKNTGAAFSIMSDSTILLGIISILFCIGVAVYWYKKKPQNEIIKLALTLVFAGAFGNAIDRIFRGFVVDFISTVFVRFPVFNIADIAITCGAALLAVYLILFDKDGTDDEKNSVSGKSE